jgi:hypothetical protein
MERDSTFKREPLESAISLHQFFGIDIIPFAVELAKVTLMLAKELELIEAQKLTETDQLMIEEKPLPLDNLDNNITCADALFIQWPKVDAIIGNPPFQSKNKAQKELGAAYLQRVRKEFPDVPGRADYCVYWFRKTHDQLAPGTRAGLVGTNTIRQNYSREGGLDYIVANGGLITDAVSTQAWSGEAAVHVSIVNWTKDGKASDSRYLSLQRGDRDDSPWETFELPSINPALSPGADVTGAHRLKTNIESRGCFQGQIPGHEAFLLPVDHARRLIRSEPRLAEILFPHLIGDEMLRNFQGQPNRYVIDFYPRDAIEASSYGVLFELIKERVLPAREAAAAAERERNANLVDKRGNQHHANFLKRWWLLSYPRPDLMEKLRTIPRYVSCCLVTKRPIFEFVSSAIHPNVQLVVFPFSDDYSFGILQSNAHWEWFKAKCSTLEERFRYTSDTVFDTFPWPQNPTRSQINAVVEAAIALRALRRETMDKLKFSLRDLYRTLDEPGVNPLREAHARLDTTVRAVYGMPDAVDPLAFLLELNLACATKEKAGKKITAPGLPLPSKEHAAFISDDSIQPPEI